MKPPSFIVHNADALECLRTLQDDSINCCVTSPPYYALRHYGVDGQIGLEETPEEYIAKLVAVFHEVKRVLRNDGVFWLNIGDSYSRGTVGRKDTGDAGGAAFHKSKAGYGGNVFARKHISSRGTLQDRRPKTNPKQAPKNLLLIPARLSIALQDDGWIVRNDVIWHKPAVTPESMKDRLTRSHEHIFLLVKSKTYYYDNKAIAEPCVLPKNIDKRGTNRKYKPTSYINAIRKSKVEPQGETRNCRDVWTINPKPCRDIAHFAMFPPEIPRRCILAGCPEGGVVLDPFSGAGTTGLVAVELGRNCIGIELNEEFIDFTQERYNNRKRKAA
jgi:DNA modification methylase